MKDMELSAVLDAHEEYTELSSPVSTGDGEHLFTFTNELDELVEYRRTEDGYIATYIDIEGTTRQYRVEPQISIRVSTLVVNRYGYSMIEDTTPIGTYRRLSES